MLKCRKARSLSQAAAAAGVGISPPAMCKAANGKPIDYQTAKKIANFYEVSVLYLSGEEGPTSERLRILKSIADLLDFMRTELQNLVNSYRESFASARAQTRTPEAAREKMSREL